MPVAQFGTKKKAAPTKSDGGGFPSLPSLPSLPTLEAPELELPNPFSEDFEFPNPLGIGPRGTDTTSTSYQVRAYEEGTDFLFFQSPGPKTAVQEDLPDFFSADNIKFILGQNIITPVRLAVGAVGLTAFLAVAITVYQSPGQATPFEFIDPFIPVAKQYRAEEKQKRVDYEAKVKAAKDAEIAKAKAAAEEAAAKQKAEAAAASKK